MKQGYAYEVRDNNGLTADVLRAKVPALFAQEPHESRSARYTYVPTIEIIKGMLKEGFVPVQAMQAKPKQADKLEYAKHLVKFRRAGELVVGEDIAEIVLVNSHDGSSSYQLMGGVFRVVCTNGLIRGDLQNDIRVPHKGDILDGVIDAAYTVTYMASETLEHVNEMKALPIPAAERNLFAEY
jgi:hypothetical protein